jgi:hypothetical protein
MSDPFKTCGPSELCTWCYGPGICRFQTTSFRIARKLSQRRGASLVAWSLTNQYLRVFEEEIEPWRARLLVTRYLKPTNGVLLGGVASQKKRKPTNRGVDCATKGKPFVGQLQSQNAPGFTRRSRLKSESARSCALVRSLPKMVRLSPQETQTFIALLEALNVPQKANCSARDCVEVLLAIERKLVRNLRTDTAPEEQSPPTV